MRSFGTLIGVSCMAFIASSAVKADGIDPFYTGSLISPSPAVPKAGLLAVEPYVFYSINPGSYGPNGGFRSSANKTTALQTLTLLKYGITDHLSIELLPQSSWNFDQRGFDSGSQFGDLPVELEYRLLDQDKKTGKPSITASVGMNVPTGRYQNLYGPADGSGSGTYRVRLGLLAQSLLYGESQHPVRIRLYATGSVPVSGVGIHCFSAFGTDGSFNGYAESGLGGSVGASVEYSITQKIVFAFDVYHAYNLTSHVYGVEANGVSANSQSGNADNTQIAPAIEYSFNDNFGIIAGVALTVQGDNTSSLVQPQIAFNFVF